MSLSKPQNWGYVLQTLLFMALGSGFVYAISGYSIGATIVTALWVAWLSFNAKHFMFDLFGWLFGVSLGVALMKAQLDPTIAYLIGAVIATGLRYGILRQIAKQGGTV